jgi:hypothetical protein
MGDRSIRRLLTSWARRWFHPIPSEQKGQKVCLRVEALEPREMPAVDFYNVLRNTPLDVAAS